MSAAREPRPTTGKKKPPLSPLDVAMRLALLTADSIMDASIIMLGADEAVRPDMAFGWWMVDGGEKAQISVRQMITMTCV